MFRSRLTNQADQTAIIQVGWSRWFEAAPFCSSDALIRFDVESIYFHLHFDFFYQEWSMCITKSFRSLAYFVIASNSTAIYVAAFVVNHAVQEDVISGIPLVFIFGLFLLMRPFPGENVMRLLAFYSALSLIFRKMFRLATAASVIYQQNYNLTQSLAFCDQQLDISNSTTYVTLSNSKYMFITAGSFSEVFVIMAIQLHMSVRRSRGITNHID
jgi:hypothetical protein